jgi:hypothetical protein
VGRQHLAHQKRFLSPFLDRLTDQTLGGAISVHLSGVDQRQAEVEAKS